jgi:hypothetical protein
MARSYKRDKRGRFASTGSGGGSGKGRSKSAKAADEASAKVASRRGYKNQTAGHQTGERLKARAEAKRGVKAAANASRSEKAKKNAARAKALATELKAQQPYLKGKSAKQIGKMQEIAFKRVNRKFR